MPPERGVMFGRDVNVDEIRRGGRESRMWAKFVGVDEIRDAQ